MPENPMDAIHRHYNRIVIGPDKDHSKVVYEPKNPNSADDLHAELNGQPLDRRHFLLVLLAAVASIFGLTR